MKIISLGEILWDVFEHGELLGGAPFNFAAHIHRLRHNVLFVSAVGEDDRGSAALEKMRELGLSTRFVQRTPDAPTGIVPVNLDSTGQPRFVIQRPAAYDLLSLTEREIAALSSPEAEWICFGTLHQCSANARQALAALLEANPHARRFYDVNLRPESYDKALVDTLLKESTVVKLNDEEAKTLEEIFGEDSVGIEEFSRSHAKRYGWEAVCVTRGARGCAILVGEEYVEVAGYPVTVIDTVGSGDAFSAAFLHGLANNWPPAEIGDFANRLGALVAGRRGAIPPWTIEEAMALSRQGAD
ncbi:MAG: carbohydrate kinase family protein [Terriglobia bacterium]